MGKKKEAMPSKEVVEEQFAVLMQNLAIKDSKKREGMKKLSPETKWLMIKQYENEYSTKKQDTQASVVSQLKSVVSAKDMEAITVDMTSKPVPWLVGFVKEGGVPPLFVQLTTVLSKPEKVESDVKLLGNFVNCIRGLMNGSEEAIKAVSVAKGATLALIKCLDYIQPKAHRLIWELLVAICYISEDSHVQLAENLGKVYKPVDGKKKTSGIKKLKWFLEKGDDGSKGIVMTLVNGLVNKCALLDDRMATRTNIGIDKLLKEKLEKISNERLVHQLVIYKEEEEADEEEFAELDSGVKEAKNLATHLLENLAPKPMFHHFVSLLRHIDLMRTDEQIGNDSFLLLDMVSVSIAHSSHNGDIIPFAKETCDNTLQELGYVDESNTNKDEAIVRLKEAEAQIAKHQEGVKRSEEALEAAKKAAREAKESNTKLRVEANDLRQALEAKGGALPPKGGDPAKEAALQSKIDELQKQLSDTEQQLKEAKEAPPPAILSNLPEETDENKELLEAIEQLKGQVANQKEELENTKKDLAAAREAGAAPPPPVGGPPPPPGGGPPPPPGGGPGRPAGRPPKEKVKTSVKMKAFNWSKIPDAKIDGTMWEKIDDSKSEVDLDKLSEMFCNAKPKPKEEEGGEGGAGAKKKEKKPQAATVLDFNRSNNINILVKRFKKTPEEMKKAVIGCDEDIMGADNIRALLKVVPTSDELEMIKEYPNPEELGGAEKFLMALGEIPKLEARLKALLIKTAFEKRAGTIGDAMSVLEKAIDEVADSKKLPEFLQVVLKVGNYMNGTGNRGGAWGFKLTDLVKLGDTKSVDNKTTLLSFLIQGFEKGNPDLITLPEDFPSSGDASRESLLEVSKDVNQLEADRNFSRKLVEGENVEHDAFYKTITSFLEEADTSLEDLSARKTTIEIKFTKVKKSYFELPATDTSSFFETLNKFWNLYTQTHEGILRQRKAAEDKAKAEKRRQEAFSKKPNSGGGGGGGDGGADGDMGALDKILHQAQTGGARVNRQPKRPGPGMPGMGPPGGGGFDPAALRAGLKKRQADS